MATQAQHVDILNQAIPRSIRGQRSQGSEGNCKSNETTNDAGFADKIKAAQGPLDARSVACR